MKPLLFALLVLSPLVAKAQPDPNLPRIVDRNGHFALMVDGKPFLMLGAQIGNSSSWASSLPLAWTSLENLHANTIEAPVYWETLEATPNNFDFSTVDLLVNGAREHHMHLVLLWFGTWKNGQNHYVPEWIKSDPKKYPRELSSYGKVLDVMSPNSAANLAADKHAFAALMRHVKEIDGDKHTVIMIQVENESGSVGSVRDFSPEANRQFATEVPASLKAGRGTWSQVYGADADERFAAYSTARYIGEVAAAGKAEYPIPMYCNVWITYPVHALENRDHPSPGQEYPSGGPQQANVGIWKAAAPAIDVLAPDYYSDDMTLFHQVVATYARPDNPLFIPETGFTPQLGDYLFYALGHGAIGFSPFGVDRPSYFAPPPAAATNGRPPAEPSENFALLAPMAPELAQLNLEGKLQTAVEEKGQARQRIHFPNGVDAVISYGYPQRDGEFPPGTPDASGRALVAQLGPYEFLVTGFNASVSFVLAPLGAQNQQLEILQAEQGIYKEDRWQRTRILNGDQTDRGLNFRGGNTDVARIRLHLLPLYDPSLHKPQADSARLMDDIRK